MSSTTELLRLARSKIARIGWCQKQGVRVDMRTLQPTAYCISGALGCAAMELEATGYEMDLAMEIIARSLDLPGQKKEQVLEAIDKALARLMPWGEL